MNRLETNEFFLFFGYLLYCFVENALSRLVRCHPIVSSLSFFNQWQYCLHLTWSRNRYFTLYFEQNYLERHWSSHILFTITSILKVFKQITSCARCEYKFLEDLPAMLWLKNRFQVDKFRYNYGIQYGHGKLGSSSTCCCRLDVVW